MNQSLHASKCDLLSNFTPEALNDAVLLDEPPVLDFISPLPLK